MTPELAAFLANLVLILHALLATFVVGGWLITVIGGLCGWQWVRNFWFRAIHLLVVSVIVLESVFGTVCPLTRWEEQLRNLAGQEGTDELEQLGFLLYYLRRILFLPDHWEWSQTVLMWAYIAFGVGVLATWIFFPPRWPQWRASAGRLSSDARNAGKDASEMPNAGEPGSDTFTNTGAPGNQPFPSKN